MSIEWWQWSTRAFWSIPTFAATQVEWSIPFSLTSALYGEFIIEKGGVAQGSFNDYRILRINEWSDTILLSHADLRRVRRKADDHRGTVSRWPTSGTTRVAQSRYRNVAIANQA
jgi:hypothetical protein